MRSTPDAELDPGAALTRDLAIVLDDPSIDQPRRPADAMPARSARRRRGSASVGMALILMALATPLLIRDRSSPAGREDVTSARPTSERADSPAARPMPVNPSNALADVAEIQPETVQPAIIARRTSHGATTRATIRRRSPSPRPSTTIRHATELASAPRPPMPASTLVPVPAPNGSIANAVSVSRLEQREVVVINRLNPRPAQPLAVDYQKTNRDRNAANARRESADAIAALRRQW